MLSGKLDFKGTVSEVSANAEVKGHLAVSTGALTDFIAAVVRATGQAQPKFDSSVVGNFTFDGGIEYTPTRLAVTDFKMSMGGETATGTLALEEGKAPSLTGHVALAKIDLEKWLALLAVPGAFQPATPPAAAPAAAVSDPAPPSPPAARRRPSRQRRPAKSNSLSPFPAGDGRLAVARHRRGPLPQGHGARPRGGARNPQGRDHRAAAQGRAAGRHGAAGQRRRSGRARGCAGQAGDPPATPAAGAVQATGDFSLAGPKLRDTLAWLGIDTSGVPADKLQKLDLKGKLASTAGGLQIAGLTVDLDGQQATGSGGVAFALPLTADGDAADRPLRPRRLHAARAAARRSRRPPTP